MKTLLCPCEDLTLAEVEDAIGRGYDTLEDVKRYTGLATGSCQGRLCVVPCLRVLARVTGRPVDAFGLITYRPPVDPVPLALLAAGEPEPEGDPDG